jgi:hypothetical protein
MLGRPILDQIVGGERQSEAQPPKARRAASYVILSTVRASSASVLVDAAHPRAHQERT